MSSFVNHGKVATLSDGTELYLGDRNRTSWLCWVFSPTNTDDDATSDKTLYVGAVFDMTFKDAWAKIETLRDMSWEKIKVKYPTSSEQNF